MWHQYSAIAEQRRLRAESRRQHWVHWRANPGIRIPQVHRGSMAHWRANLPGLCDAGSVKLKHSGPFCTLYAVLRDFQIAEGM